MLTIKAPCKINLHLAIRGKRPDGFHDLESIFLALAFGDTLCFERRGDEGVCALSVDWHVPLERGMVFPPEKNIVYRAVSLFRERTGFSEGITVHLEKRIPLGAGLGGGSSDAASALLALNTVADTKLSREALGELAAELGSDVPFFIVAGEGGAALVSGRGERLRPLEVPRGLWVVLVYPGFESGTADAFRLLDEWRRDGEGESVESEALARALMDAPSMWRYGNDFLPVFLDAGKGVYQEILEDLRRRGADFAGLSGSGSTCFGIFSDRETAKRSERAVAGVDGFSGKRRNFVRLTIPLACSIKRG